MQSFGPRIDSYLPPPLQYISRDPRVELESGKHINVPIIIGICSNEGAFVKGILLKIFICVYTKMLKDFFFITFNLVELWLDLARKGYQAFKNYALTTLLENILLVYGLNENAVHQMKNIISWRLFNNGEETVEYLLNSVQRLVSETKFESPFIETIKRFAIKKISSSIDKMYVYTFHRSETMDIRGMTNFFGGASHTSDLLFLMGPSLFQQISRRKLTSSELRMCKRFRRFFVDFIKTGNPTPGRVIDAWHPFSTKRKFIQILGDITSRNELHSNGVGDRLLSPLYWEKNIAEIKSLIHSQMQITTTNLFNPYHINNSNTSQIFGDYQNSNEYLYYNELSKIHEFWTYVLPNLYNNKHLNLNMTFDSQTHFCNNNPSYKYKDYNEEGKKFKHAFFSLLMLMSLMLFLLCICVMILRKNKESIDPSLF